MATDITEQIVREAPELEGVKVGLLTSAKELIDRKPHERAVLPGFEVAGMSPDQIAALERGRQGIGAYQPFLEAGQAALEQSMRGLGDQMRQISAEDIQRYMDPYADQVLQAQISEMNRQANIQRQNLQGQATQVGAFGGSRQAVQEAELGRGLAAAQAQAIAQSNQQNYAQALAAAQQQQQQLAQMASQYGNLGIQQAALGQTAQQMAQRDVDMLYGLGQQQQAQYQAELDAKRAGQLQEYYLPYQDLQFLSDIYKGAPSSQMSVTAAATPTASPFQQVTGALTGGIAATNAARSAGLL